MPLHRDELRHLGTPIGGSLRRDGVYARAIQRGVPVLRAQSIGSAARVRAVVLVVMNVVYACRPIRSACCPIASIARRCWRSASLLVVADLVLAFATGIAGVGIGVVLWGLHMGFTQGLLATLVADAAPAELRGTAFGVFNLMTGVALLFASLVAGALWDMTGPQGTFLAGAAFAL